VGQHVLERVVEGAQVRIDLLLQVPGQEPERLARLHRRTRQHDPPHALPVQRVDRHRHGEVRLARPRRPDRDDDVALDHRGQVRLLPGRLRLDDLLRPPDPDLAVLQPAERVSLVGLQRPVVARHVVGVEPRPRLDQLDQVLHQHGGAIDRLRLALDPQLPAAHDEPGAARGLDPFQVLVVGPEEGQLIDATEGNRPAGGRRRVGGHHALDGV